MTPTDRAVAVVDRVLEWARRGAEKAATRHEAAAYGAIEIVARNARSRIRMRLDEARACPELHPAHIRNTIYNEAWDILRYAQSYNVPEARELDAAIRAGQHAGVLT